MRVFIALLFPVQVVNKLSEKINELSKDYRGQYTLVNNLHLTLFYIGEVSKDQLKLVITSMKNIEFERFSYTLRGISSFKKKQRLVYVSIDYKKELMQLRERVVEALVKTGLEIEFSLFKPHVTLGRKVMIDEEWLTKLDFGPIDTGAIKISVMESKQINGVLRYIEIASSKFQ